MFCQLNLISKKGPQFENVPKMQKIIKTLKKFFLARFAHSAFYKIRISGAANLHAPVQYSKYVVVFLLLFFFIFFLSSYHDKNLLLHLYHFCKKNIIIYWLISTVNHQRSYFPFLSSFRGSNIFAPQKIL